ncbi:MAG: endonuclease III [Spirochaetota bacterium]|nr:MAG: endonuclease III [Spirochaetota bacterium]
MDFSEAENKRRVSEILALLKKRYPDARVLLDYNSPFELLIATILAAQCTDERVNQVTPSLFSKFGDPAKMSEASAQEIEEIIRPTGFFKAKTKSLLGTSEALTAKFKGQVPETMEELITLPGVGRKTANVVLGNCFNKPAIMVDTHVKRVSTRLGFTDKKDPDKIEFDLKEIIPEKDHTLYSRIVTFHGRYTCIARKPKCSECVVESLCPFPEKNL